MLLCTLAATLLVQTVSANAYERHLKMNSNYRFKIVQFSDMLIDESSEHFVRTQSMVQNIIYNENPDLIVLTGDTVVTSENDNYKSRFQTAVEFFKTRGLSWISTGGNVHENGLSREEILKID